jgi:transposase InsO family protein
MVLGVRREGYFDWIKRPTPIERDADLVATLKTIRAKHSKYGTQSLIEKLPADKKCSYGKGYRLCRDNGLLTKRMPKSITRRDKDAEISMDLINRGFRADAPGEKWYTDITEIKCSDGKGYHNYT